MATGDDDPVKRAGMVAIFASWQRAAYENQYQSRIRDEASKKSEEALASLKACREACKAFGVDVSDGDQLQAALDAFGVEASKVFNQTKPNHLPEWHYKPPPAPTVSEPETSSPPQLESPPPPPMPRMKDAILEYLALTHDLDMGGQKASEIRTFIEEKYSTSFHEKTVGMTLYRLLKDEKVRRKGHRWFFVPQGDAAPKNPGVDAPGSVEGR